MRARGRNIDRSRAFSEACVDYHWLRCMKPHTGSTQGLSYALRGTFSLDITLTIIHASQDLAQPELGRVGSFLARHAWQTGHSVMHLSDSLMARKMSPEKRREGMSLPSLPEDLLNDIGSVLGDKDVCMLEVASKALYDVLSRPSRSRPGKHQLDLDPNYVLMPYNPDVQVRSFLDAVSLLWCHHVLCFSLESRRRWCQLRIRRYSQVFCTIYDKKMLEGSDSLNKGTPNGAIPPVLPPLLAACAPSAEFLLTVQSNVAEAFLATSRGCTSPGPGPELSPFWSNLQQHLTELHLWLDPAEEQPPQMGPLSMLSALEQLDVSCVQDPVRYGQSPLTPLTEYVRGMLDLEATKPRVFADKTP